MAIGCDIPLPVSTINDFRFVRMACYEDARRTKARSVYYKYYVTGNFETRFGDTKVVSFNHKSQANPIKPSGKVSQRLLLHTDASDYGVGGYVFQAVDGIDQPVVFVSRSLNKSQLRWSMIQKEVYGIFFSCMYLQSLLCDRLFTIRTDHRNLLLITEASNPMIVRWYMALSEFSFTLEFIPGVDNDNADSLSRLCRNDMIDSPKEYSPEYILSALHIESYEPSSSQYSKIGILRLLAIMDLNVHLNVSSI